MILLLFAFSTILFISIFLLKKSLWLSVKNANAMSFQQSFFCWFTLSDINNKTSLKNWIYALNNVTTLIMLFCMLIMLICLVLTGIAMVG
jgi:hypothetical protein